MRTATRTDSPLAAARMDPFDRAMGELTTVNGVDQVKASTQVVTDFYGRTVTFIVQTFRWRDPADPKARARDTVFVQQMDAEGGARFVLPFQVSDAIASQREALTARSRRRAGEAAAEARQANGAPNPLADPKVRAKAREARKAKAAERRARRARKAARR